MMWFVCWLSGMIRSLTLSWVGFDPIFKRFTCLATLMSSDIIKLSVDGNIYIYIYIYIL